VGGEAHHPVTPRIHAGTWQLYVDSMLTIEDLAIWKRVWMANGNPFQATDAHDDDVRDASLMLRLARFSSVCDDVRVRQILAAFPVYW
jgi:hypothetical protein